MRLGHEPRLPTVWLGHRAAGDHARGDRVVEHVVRAGPVTVFDGDPVPEHDAEHRRVPGDHVGQAGWVEHRPDPGLDCLAGPMDRRDGIRVAQDLERSHGGRGRDPVAGVGPAVTDVLRHEAHDVAPAAESRRRVPVAHRLGKCREIGRDPEILGSPALREPEAGLHLVEDQQDPELPGGRYEIEKQNAIERQQGEEKQKLAARQAWVDLQNTEASKRKMEDTQKQAAGQELLVKMGSVGGSLPTSELKFKTIGTDFFSTGKSSEIQFQPIGTDRYPTSDFSEAKRLLGSTYFLGNALDAARNGDYESARFFGEQADKVMTGQPTDVKCGFPAMPDVPEPSDPKKVDANKQKLANLLSNFKEDVKSLQDIEYKISESKEKIKNAELKKEEATTRVDELHNRAATAKPEEQAEVDDLAKQAQKQLQDAAKELDQAKQFQSDELAKKEKLENELDNMRTQQATMQAGDK